MSVIGEMLSYFLKAYPSGRRRANNRKWRRAMATGGVY